jgi:hypothetical protein
MSNSKVMQPLKFELWISFEIDSPSVHHFVRTLSFDIFMERELFHPPALYQHR